ncbi:MAG: c-type cytochrome [Planctomycetota bacterium]
MNRAYHPLFAICLLPLLGLCLSCGGGESTDTPEENTPAATENTPSAPSEPAATETAAKTNTGMDALEALEADAAKAVVISEAAQKMYDSYCFTCHGTGGKGDGPAGAALNPKPADFTSADWQGTVTDEHLATVIADGGVAAGKSPLMPPAPGVKGNDELLNGLVAIVRGFSK